MKKAEQKLTFKGFKDGVWFELHTTPPSDTIQFRLKGETPYRVNPNALQLYFLYRKTVQNSYAEKGENLAPDIQKWKKTYDAHQKFEGNNLHHYAVDACLDAIQEWLKQEKPVQCFMAYEQSEWGPKIAGFVHFYRTQVKDKDVVYIAQAGAAVRNAKIGTRLMKLVMSHFEPETEFYILTRNFNAEAIHLYKDKLGYTDIKADEIHELGCDERYVGFKHTTSEKELEDIKKDLIEVENNTIDQLILSGDGKELNL